MQRLRARLVVLMVIGVLVQGACNNSKLFQSTDDKAITTNIQAKLFNDPILKTRDIHVDSRNGVVTVSGMVSTDLEKAAVERIATQEEGVKNVVNTLSVSAASANSAPEGVQTAQTAAPPEQAVPPAAPVGQAPEKPRHVHHAPAVSKNEDNASAQLEAYTNSVSPDAAANPSPAAAAPAASAQGTTTPAAPASAPPPSPVPAPVAPPAPKPPEQVTIPAGTVVTIRMVDNIDSSRNQPGEEFAASVDSPIVLGDRVLAPRGSDARVRLVDAKNAGRISGQSQLQLELISLTMNGVHYPVKSGFYEQHGASRGTRSAETIGGGAVLGALVGGLLGRGKGAAIGSVVGAGAGTAAQVSTKGQQVKVPAETKLDFTLKEPVTVTMPANP